MSDDVMKTLNPKERNLYLTTRVDQDSISAIIKEIVIINAEEEKLLKSIKNNGLKGYKSKPIVLHIDSYGGDVYSCLGLISVMQNSKIPVHTVVLGCAMSAGFNIACAGAKRFIHEHSTMMYHQMTTFEWDKLSAVKEDVIAATKLEKIVLNIIFENTNITKKQIKKVHDKKTDWYFSAKEALKYGIVDEIISKNKIVKKRGKK